MNPTLQTVLTLIKASFGTYAGAFDTYVNVPELESTLLTALTTGQGVDGAISALISNAGTVFTNTWARMLGEAALQATLELLHQHAAAFSAAQPAA